MKRTVTGFCMAAAIGCVTTLGAQTSTTPTTAGQSASTDKARDVTITGCLSKGADGKFMLTNAVMDHPSAGTTASGTSTTTAGTTTAGTTAGTTTSTTASTSGATSHAAMSWMLAGGSDLDKHVGHKIQVTGRTSWDHAMDHSRTPGSTTATAGTTAGTTGTSGTTATASAEQKKDMRADQPRLDVQSVKMVAASCS